MNHSWVHQKTPGTGPNGCVQNLHAVASTNRRKKNVPIPSQFVGRPSHRKNASKIAKTIRRIAPKTTLPLLVHPSSTRNRSIPATAPKLHPLRTHTNLHTNTHTNFMYKTSETLKVRRVLRGRMSETCVCVCTCSCDVVIVVVVTKAKLQQSSRMHLLHMPHSPANRRSYLPSQGSSHCGWGESACVVPKNTFAPQLVIRLLLKICKFEGSGGTWCELLFEILCGGENALYNLYNPSLLNLNKFKVF